MQHLPANRDATLWILQAVRLAGCRPGFLTPSAERCSRMILDPVRICTRAALAPEVRYPGARREAELPPLGRHRSVSGVGSSSSSGRSSSPLSVAGGGCVDALTATAVRLTARAGDRRCDWYDWYRRLRRGAAGGWAREEWAGL
jgi:hypothetical protein